MAADVSMKVKGLLTATRCLGQTWLKAPQIAVHAYLTEEKYKDPMEKFQKAYVDHEPDIQVIDMTEKDKWLILATDGMWNNIRRTEIAETVQQLDDGEKELP